MSSIICDCCHPRSYGLVTRLKCVNSAYLLSAANILVKYTDKGWICDFLFRLQEASEDTAFINTIGIFVCTKTHTSVLVALNNGQGMSLWHWEILCLCVSVASRRYLRSATYGDLLVPRTRTVTYGPRKNFAVSGPTVWNTLPSCVSTTMLGQFQSGLQTILFRLAYGTWLGAFVTV